MKNSLIIEHDDEVKRFILNCQASGIPLSAIFIIEKAKEIAISQGRDNLQCSWRWFSRFRERVGLRHGVLSGEKNSVDQVLVNEWKENEIPRIMINWQSEFIYNCDETGLFWRQVPNKTFFITRTDHFGEKIFTERISILFCVNRAGDKLPPLVIGKAEKPRCFYNDCLSELNIKYKAQVNSWMTRTMFINWLKDWHDQLMVEGKKVLLILDNFSGHRIDENQFPLITFNFLPPGTTCSTQPLDAGIIRSFKTKYLTFFVREILKRINSGHMSEIAKNINILEALNWVDLSWKDVSQNTIVNCWNNLDYVSVFDDIDFAYASENNLSDLGEALENLNNLTNNCCSANELINQISFDYQNYFD